VKVLGLMRVRNEARWLEASLRAQHFCDHIVLLDDNSTDETKAICDEFDGSVSYLKKLHDHGYEEGPDREYLAWYAGKFHYPDWICSMDGDEVLLEDTWDRVMPQLDNPDVHVIDVLNLHLWDNDFTVRVDGAWRYQYRQRFWRFKQGPLTYTKDHCSIPNEITERPFTNVGVRMLHYGNLHAADRKRRYERYLKDGYDWPTLIQTEGVETMPLEEACATLF
jgi:glycosyltransferase involved in cell wall biosynthesis